MKWAMLLNDGVKMKYRFIHLNKAKCGLDIGDGSERGEYVCQDYMINVLGRPHRMVNIMYTYYPKDKQWPMRISEACKDMEVNYQWDYPYDDYCPYDINSDKAYLQMRDIRRHGQDVLLTLTIDCSLDDDELRKVARTLRPFGRICIRINHECYGTWFTHNQRFSYEEIGKFFVRFSRIIKQEAPQVRTIFCAGRVESDPADGVRLYDAVTGSQKIKYEDEFLESYKEADIVSSDWYLALHYGWPYDIAEYGDENGRFYASSVDYMYEEYKNTYNRLCEIVGPKPFIQAEFNADGDVTGPNMQSESVLRYYRRIKEEDAGIINGISMYQFRDRGRLGLEIEDPNCSSVGIKQPIMDDYKEILFDPYFYPQIDTNGDYVDISDSDEVDIELRWGGAEDADGIELSVELQKNPVFCEVTMQEDLSIMMEINGKWFYKRAGVKTIDLMPAFFNNQVESKRVIPMRVFATPPDGENHEDIEHDDWMSNYYTKMKEAPKFRIRYEVPGVVR